MSHKQIFLTILLFGSFLFMLSCTDGIVLDPPKQFEPTHLGPPTTANQVETQTSSLNFIALIEDEFNFPYATQVLVGFVFVAFIWALINMIYGLTTSSPG